jgi:hypothetical protein
LERRLRLTDNVWFTEFPEGMVEAGQHLLTLECLVPHSKVEVDGFVFDHFKHKFEVREFAVNVLT